jgi:hypothetical protein
VKIMIEQGSHKQSVSVKVSDLLDDRQSKRGSGGGKVVEAISGGPGGRVGNSLFTTGKSIEGAVSLRT